MLEPLRQDVELRGLKAVAAALDLHPTTVENAMDGRGSQIALRLIASHYGVPWDQLPPPRKRPRRPQPSLPLPPISPELAASLAKRRSVAVMKPATSKATTGAVVESRSTTGPATAGVAAKVMPVRLPLAPELVEGHRPPKLRSDCVDGPRPCPWVRCAWHALWTRNKRDRYGDPEEMAERVAGMARSCALDVADQDGATLDVVAEVTGVTRQAVQQLEARVRGKVTRRLEDETFAEPEGFEGDW